MIGTCKFVVGEEEREIEIQDGEGVLLFQFHNNGSQPDTLLIGQAEAGEVIDAAILCLKWISTVARQEAANGQEE